MTFKIEKLGFYKMRNGGKCEVVYIHNGCAAAVHDDDNEMYRYFTTGDDAEEFTTQEFCIIAEWKEPKKVMVPEYVIGWPRQEEGKIYFGVEAGMHLGLYEVIERIPAHEVEVNE